MVNNPQNIERVVVHVGRGNKRQRGVKEEGTEDISIKKKKIAESERKI